MNSLISFCAEGIIRSAETNNISAYNILENYNTKGFPLFIQKFFFFTLLEKGDDDDNTTECQFICEIGGEELLELDVNVIFTEGGSGRTRNIIEINGLAVPRPGKLSFNLKRASDEFIISSYSIEIKQIDKPRASAKVEPSEAKEADK